MSAVVYRANAPHIMLKYIKGALNVPHATASVNFTQAKKRVEAEDAGLPFNAASLQGKKDKASTEAGNGGKKRKAAAVDDEPEERAKSANKKGGKSNGKTGDLQEGQDEASPSTSKKGAKSRSRPKMVRLERTVP